MHTTIVWRRRTVSVMLAVCVILAGLLVVGQAPARASGLRAEMLELTNKTRLNRGLRRLDLDLSLSHKARRHSKAMARRNRLYHSTNVSSYLRGARWRVWGENVGYTWDSSLASLQRAFMRSADHRHNILNRRFDCVGIGIEQARHRTWVTLIFYG